MSTPNQPTHIDDQDARGAERSGVMRYVLGISLLLAVVTMTLIWVVPALSEGDVASAELASERVREMRENGVPEDEIPGNPDSMPAMGSEATPTE